MPILPLKMQVTQLFANEKYGQLYAAGPLRYQLPMYGELGGSSATASLPAMVRFVYFQIGEIKSGTDCAGSFGERPCLVPKPPHLYGIYTFPEDVFLIPGVNLVQHLSHTSLLTLRFNVSGKFTGNVLMDIQDNVGENEVGFTS